MSNNINTRIKNKIDTEENWKKATNFIPLEGEQIIYKKRLPVGLTLREAVFQSNAG